MLQCSFLLIIQEIIIFMTSCKLEIGNYIGLVPSLYNANMWMSATLWGISGNEHDVCHCLHRMFLILWQLTPKQLQHTLDIGV